MACVIFKSAELFDWSPDVAVSPERSRWFVAVLSASAFSSAAIADRLIMLKLAKASKACLMVRVSFIGCLLCRNCRVIIAAAARAGPICCQIVKVYCQGVEFGSAALCRGTSVCLIEATIGLKEECVSQTNPYGRVIALRAIVLPRVLRN